MNKLNQATKDKIRKGLLRVTNNAIKTLRTINRHDEEYNDILNMFNKIANKGIVNTWNNTDWFIDVVQEGSSLIYNILNSTNNNGDEIDYEDQYPGIHNFMNKTYLLIWKSLIRKKLK